MIQLFKNSLKYKDSDGNMQDSGVLFASEKEKEWELIETITVEEDGVTGIVRTTESDGTPYEFKNIYVYGNVPTKPETTSTLAIYCGDGTNNFASSIFVNCFFNKNYDNVKAWGAFLESNGWLIPIASNGQNWSPSTMYTAMGKSPSAHIIKRVSISSGITDFVFPIGTTFEIYAIRA